MTLKEFVGLFANKMKEVEDAQEVLKEFVSYISTQNIVLGEHKFACVKTRERLLSRKYKTIRTELVFWEEEHMEDETFVTKLQQRWNTIKEPLLKTALAAVQEGYRLTEPSADDNFKKWDILYDRVGMQPFNIVQRTTHISQIEFLQEFIQNRWNWIDKKLNTPLKE